ncbi:MAG: hypothetical protein ACLPY1_18425 [Terracidiphilus sp.]
MTRTFQSARLKIERAKKHINDLQVAANLFAKAHPHYISVEIDSDTGHNFLRIAPADPFPDEFLPILGDALHNLRSALDHAWVQSVFVPSDHTKFPFRKTREDLEATVNGLKDNATKEVKNLIVNVIQPYFGGDGEILHHLHDLDIKDKHGLLIAHRQFTMISGITLRDLKDEGNKEWALGDWAVIPPQAATKKIEGIDHFEIANQGHAMMRVAFGEGMPLQGRFVMPTLHAMAVLVHRTVECLEAAAAATMS